MLPMFHLSSMLHPVLLSLTIFFFFCVCIIHFSCSCCSCSFMVDTFLIYFQSRSRLSLVIQVDRWKAHAPELLRWPVWRSGLLQLRVIHQASVCEQRLNLQRRSIGLFICGIIYSGKCWNFRECRWLAGKPFL